MNNNADLSDVKTAITNGQQRAANVKYRNIVNGYQAALQVVDDVVLKNYIGNLTKMPVVPLSKDILENNIKNNVLFSRLPKWFMRKKSLLHINLPVYLIHWQQRKVRFLLLLTVTA